jgi:hypothetical protein
MIGGQNQRGLGEPHRAPVRGGLTTVGRGRGRSGGQRAKSGASDQRRAWRDNGLGIARQPWYSHGARRCHRGAGASRADSKEAGGVTTVMQREGSPVAATAMVIEAGGEEAGGGSWPVHVLL